MRLLNSIFKNVLSHKIVIWIIIPFLLFYIGINLTFRDVYKTNNGLLVLIQKNSISDLLNWKETELLAGEKVDGQFTASENNLGIVAVRFHTYARINDDKVIFRIKEVGAPDWYYQNEYNVDQFQPDDLFTFGFPIIKQSKGKEYQFEVESKYGEPGNAVAISSLDPVFIEKYKFFKDDLIKDKTDLYHFSGQKLLRLYDDELVQFSIKKTINIFTDFDFLIKALYIYFMPFIFYVLWMKVIRKYYAKWYYLSFLSLVGILIEIFLLKVPSDYAYIGMVIFWIYTIYKYKLSVEVSFGITLFMLLCSPAFLYLGFEMIATRFAAWTFLFFLIVVAQTILEKYKKPYTTNLHFIFSKTYKETQKILRLRR